jgi:hypothetical protein
MFDKVQPLGPVSGNSIGQLNSGQRQATGLVSNSLFFSKKNKPL